jgi:hypothetical protein
VGSDAVVMVSAAAVTTSVKPLDAVLLTLSVTVTVNGYDPTVVAVPLSVPKLKLVPAGAVPVRLNTNGGTPPVAANAIPTEEPTCTLLKAPVVMTRGAGTMVIEMVADTLLFAESDAITPKEKEPGAVGVPCNCPPFDNCRPGGKPAPVEPLVTINV